MKEDDHRIEHTVGTVSSETSPKIHQLPPGGDQIILFKRNRGGWEWVQLRDPKEASDPTERERQVEQN